jgi:hypothetical protein
MASDCGKKVQIFIFLWKIALQADNTRLTAVSYK